MTTPRPTTSSLRDLPRVGGWSVAGGGSIGGLFSGESLPDATYRQTFRVSSAGRAVRLRFPNFHSATPLVFDAVSVGLRSGSAAAAAAAPAPARVTVEGNASFAVPHLAIVYSDPIPLAVTPADELLVSIYARGRNPLLSHDWANRTLYATTASAGDHTRSIAATAFAPVSTQSYWVDAIDVFEPDAFGAVVALGDSITDGAGTPLNTDTRWTDFLAARLNALNPGDPRRRTVFNAGIGGNTLNAVGNPQVGDNALTRLDRDVLSHSNVTEVIVFAGTNDIYVGSTSRQVIDALRRTARRLHDAGTRAIVATLIPRGRGVGWHDGLESERLAVNAWIRRQAVFDALIDLDRATRDPARPDEMLSAFDADGTHPNAAGCEAMANAIDLDLFTATTPGSSDPNPRRGGTYARQAMVTA